MLILWLCLAAAGLVLYLMLRERYKYFKKRGIPYIEPVFLLGSNPRVNLMKEDLAKGLDRLYNAAPEGAEIFGMFQFHLPIYMVKSPSLVHRILIKDFSHFHDRGIPVDEETNPLEGHLFTMSGTKWRALRNKLTPTFTSGKLKGMLPLMDTIVDQLIQVLDKQVGQEVDIKDAYSRLTTDVIGSCTFGIDAGSLKNPNSEFLAMGEKSLRPPTTVLIKNMIRTLFPSLASRFKMKLIPEDVNDFFFNVTKQTMDHRIKTGEKRNDFLQLLLELKLKGEVQTDPEELKDEDDKYLYHEVSSHQLEDNGKLVLNDGILAAQGFVFLVAGFETSATGLAFATYFLSKHQDVQEKLRQEVNEMVAKHGGFNYTAIKAMPYLAACIDEALRLYPPVPVLFRKCNRDLILDDGTKLEKGVAVFIPSYSIMRDENYFPNPEEFRPERFLEGDPIPGTFMPFGDGPRVCIAQRFALLELKLSLARMVHRYKIESCPKMDANEPFDFDPKSFILSPKGGIHCRLKNLNPPS